MTIIYIFAGSKRESIETFVAENNALGTVAVLCYLHAIKCSVVVLFH